MLSSLEDVVFASPERGTYHGLNKGRGCWTSQGRLSKGVTFKLNCK